MIEVSKLGKFKISKLLEKNFDYYIEPLLNYYGKMGVESLASFTPSSSYIDDNHKHAADCWAYKIEKSQNSASIIWTNSKTTKEDTPIVILLQYGHMTKSGVYVYGTDFINPALKPVFQKISEDLEREVTNL